MAKEPKNPNLPVDGKVSMEDRWAADDRDAPPGFDPATGAPNQVEGDDEIDIEAIEAELSDDGDDDAEAEA
jgi:hypothetical protein